MAGPLHGLKVLDFTTLLPGPFATMMLADLGADVLRVEAPNRPDLIRIMPPFDGDVSAAHALVNRGKRAIALDMKTPMGADVVKRLVKTYDVVIEQFRPGVMDRLGVGYDTLKAVNPRVIYCSLTGYGQSGPMKDRAGHDLNYLAIAGILSVSGRKSAGPVPGGIQIADVGCGSYNSVVSILSAYIHRLRTEEGQYIDVSMTDGAVGYMSLLAASAFLESKDPEREGGLLNGGGFYDCYESKDGEYMSVGSIEPQFWNDFCKAMDHPEWVNKQMLPDKQMEEFKEEMRSEFRAKTRDEWTEIFSAYDACVEPVLKVSEMLEHPHVKERSMIVDMPKPDGTTQRQVGSPFKFSSTSPEIRHIGVPLGEHNVDVLREVGYSDNEIEELKGSGLFGK